MRHLTQDQRARVEEVAREAGTTCEGCGSVRLRCGEEARRTHDHGLRPICVAPRMSPLGVPTSTSRPRSGRTSAHRRRGLFT